MFYLPRDPEIELIKARKNHSCYGMSLGIMLLDEVYPGFPGDVRNASGFPYPIQYDIVENIDIHKLVWEPDKTQCRQPILDAAKRLEKMGCKAIAAECGYFAYFQQDVAGYVDIPVFMSSLLQVPMIQQAIGPKKKVAIVAAIGKFLKEEHLINVGIDPQSNYLIAGAQDEYGCTEFDNLWNAEVRPTVPEAYFTKAQNQMVAMCKDLVAKHPDIGAIMLECTGMQPFARAIQREVDLPVYSWGTLLDYANSVVNHRDYYGHI
ncbi:MAG: aspartate/glutamate racemase family protein [Eubacteriaceae bacterium]